MYGLSKNSKTITISTDADIRSIRPEAKAMMIWDTPLVIDPVKPLEVEVCCMRIFACTLCLWPTNTFGVSTCLYLSSGMAVIYSKGYAATAKGC